MNGEDVTSPSSHRTGRNLAALSGGQLVTWTMTLLWTFVVPRELGPGGLGRIVSGWAVAGVLGTVLGLGTRTYLVRAIVLDPSQSPRLLGTALVLRLCLAPLFVAAVVAYAAYADYGAEGTLVLYLASGATLLTLLAEPFQSAFQAFERMEYLAYSDVINKSAQGLLGVALALVGFRSVGLTACWLVVSGVVVIVNALWVRPLSRIDVRTSARRLTVMARESASFWAFGLFFMVYLWIDSVMLSLLTRPEVVGWYGVPTRLFQTLMFLPVMVSTAWLPRLVKAHEQGSDDFHSAARRPVDLVLRVSLPIAAGTIAVAGPLIDLLYGPSYRSAVPVLVVLGLCVPPMYVNTMLGSVVIAAGRQRLWTWVMAGATILNPPLNLALIHLTDARYGNGAIGAALSLLGTELVMVGFGFVVVGAHLLDRGALRHVAAGLVAAGGLVAAASLARPLGALVSLALAGAAYVVLATALRVATAAEVSAARAVVAALRHRVVARISQRGPSPRAPETASALPDATQ